MHNYDIISLFIVYLKYVPDLGILILIFNPKRPTTLKLSKKSVEYLVVCVCIFEMKSCSCPLGWSAMAQSQLTATSASWVQVIPLPKLSELGL